MKKPIWRQALDLYLKGIPPRKIVEELGLSSVNNLSYMYAKMERLGITYRQQKHTKITREIVDGILKDLGKMSYDEIAEKYGISKSVVFKIIRRAGIPSIRQVFREKFEELKDAIRRRGFLFYSEVEEIYGPKFKYAVSKLRLDEEFVVSRISIGGRPRGSIKYSIYDLFGFDRVKTIIYSRRNVKGARKRLYRLFHIWNPAPSAGKLKAFAFFANRIIPLEEGQYGEGRIQYKERQSGTKAVPEDK